MLKKIFLSYCHADLEVMNQLQKQLHLHGLSTWRDKNNLRPGEPVEQTCRQNVADADDTDSYLLIVTNNSLKSEGVNWELEEAIKRNQQDPDFKLYFYLHDVVAGQARKVIKTTHNGFDLYERLFVRYTKNKEGSSQTIKEVHRQLASDLLKDKMVRYRGQGFIQDDTVYLKYETRSMKENSGAHLEVNLCEYYSELNGVPTPTEWEQEILPALKTIKTILDGYGVTNIMVESNAHLAAFIPLGFAFQVRSGFTIQMEERVYQSNFFFSGVGGMDEGLPTETLLEISSDEEPSNLSGVILEVSVSVDVSHGVDQYIEERASKNYVRYSMITPEIRDGKDSRNHVRDAQHEYHIACQFERYLQKILNKHRGIPIHLFVASPKGVALLLGHRIRSFENVHFHDFDGMKYHDGVHLR